MDKKIIFITVLFLLTISISCTKIRENRIEGSWEYVSVSSGEASIDETWIFYESGQLIIKKVYNETSTTAYDTASYYVKSEGLAGYVEVLDAVSYTNGKYRIKKLTAKQLKILRLLDELGNSEYVLKEFIRISK
jgi:hypothetical protein